MKEKAKPVGNRFSLEYGYSYEESTFIRQLEGVEFESVRPRIGKKGRIQQLRLPKIGGETGPMAFPEIIRILGDEDNFGIALVGLSASGKSTLRRKMKRAARIIYPDREFVFVDVLAGDVRITMFSERDETSTDNWTGHIWREFNRRLETRRRVSIYAARHAPWLIENFVNQHGQPGRWSEETLNQFIEKLTDLTEGRARRQDYIKIMKVFYERPLFGGPIKVVGNQGLRELVEDVNGSNDTELFILYPDIKNQETALLLQNIVRANLNNQEKLLRELSQKLPFIIPHGITLDEFVQRVLESAPPTSIIGNFEHLVNLAFRFEQQLRNVYGKEYSNIFASYVWREPNSRYGNLVPEGQIEYRVLEAFIKWWIRDLYCCKKARFIYDPHSKEPLFVGEEL